MVEGAIRSFEEQQRCVAGEGFGGTKTGSDAAATGQAAHVNQVLANALSDDFSLAGFGGAEQNREFVSSEAGNGVSGADASAEDGADAAKYGVPGEVTELVIHALEEIEIDEEQAEFDDPGGGAFELSDERLFKSAPVQEAGKSVCVGAEPVVFLLRADGNPEGSTSLGERAQHLQVDR